MKKSVISFVIFIVILASAISNSSDNNIFNGNEPIHAVTFDSTSIEIPLSLREMPEQILVRQAYTTSYNSETKCPNWVAWHLLRENCDGDFTRDGVPYYDDNNEVYGIGFVTTETSGGGYFVDLEVGEPRQELNDWKDKRIKNNSHGHICPAGDCKWSKIAMNQSFLLTNMCPQDKSLNSGDWKSLETRCRKWAKHYDDIYIVAGPVFYNGISRTMGANKVGVPDAFFKVILCLQEKPKALGFIFPNNAIHHELADYMKSVDEIEEITGFDFFYNLPDDIESEVERHSDLSQWK